MIEIEAKLKKLENRNDYVPFEPADYVDNPIALARINAHVTQKELAKQMKVSQAYISKIKQQEKVISKLLLKAKEAINKLSK